MTQPYARVLAHSVNWRGQELITFEVTCHRWILAEVNTHRALSRNWRSSRAVPFVKLVEEVRNNPAMPVVWGKNNPGMVSHTEMRPDEAIFSRRVWITAANNAADMAQSLADEGMHKQWVNRIIEPYLMVHGVISGTNWANFYHLRRSPDAQPEFKALADAMWLVHKASKPKLLSDGQWHLPYITDEDYAEFSHLPLREMYARLRDISVARVARVSLRPFDGSGAYIQELRRTEKMRELGHMSPFEHQAQALAGYNYFTGVKYDSGNFAYSWSQYRKFIRNETITQYEDDYFKVN